ncbi:MAG: hypothetical protein LBN74_06320 [Prevotella sp.]|jgi:hypothetical protein|nr:hypothetical protein [Prevotella sp.]
MSITHINDRQTQYALRMYKCLPVMEDGEQVDNLVHFTVDRPFILLHAFVVRQTEDTDRYSDLNQGISNALLYLDPHPVVQVMNVANVSAFHVAPNRYYIQDLRPVDGDVDNDGNELERNDFQQYVFVLLCTNF